MPTITYHEFRPGKWVKVVDGKIVGPATAAEVAAWKQEKATLAGIWQDVVATASRRPTRGEAKVSTSPGAAGEAPAREGADKSAVWEELVKRTKPSIQAESPPERCAPKEDADWAEQVRIWQSAGKRAKKPAPQPEREPAQGAPTLPQPASEKTKPAAKASAVAAAKAVQATPATRQAGEGASTKKAFTTEVTKAKLPTQAPKPAAKPEQKASLAPKAPVARPAAKSAPPPKLPTKAGAKPTGGRTPGSKTPPEPALPAKKAPPAKAATQGPVAKLTKKTKSAAKAAPVKRAAAPRTRPEPVSKRRLPAKLLDKIAAEEHAEPTQAAAATEAPGAGTSPKRSPAPISRRPSAKVKTTAAQERPNQLYLWIAAGQGDDLIATLRTGLSRYQERFSHPAEVVLCHSADLPALEGAKLPVDLREGKSLPPRNFWIGLK